MIGVLHVLLSVSLGFLAATPGAATNAAPLAIIAAVKGHVEVVPARGGPATAAAFGKPLVRGDRVSVAAGGSATVFFNNGNLIELGEKSALTVGVRATAVTRLAEPPLSGDVVASVNRFVAGGSRETGLVGLTPLRGGRSTGPLLIEPRRTNLLANGTRFTWHAVEGATRYRITVSGEQGELWHRELTDTLIDYPHGVPELTAGADIAWEVVAFSDHDELRREASVVHVLSPGDAEAARRSERRLLMIAGGPDRAAARYLVGSYLYGQGLYVDSIREFEALMRLAPDSPSPHEALGNVYRAMGLNDRAADEYRQALALTH